MRKIKEGSFVKLHKRAIPRSYIPSNEKFEVVNVNQKGDFGNILVRWCGLQWFVSPEDIITKEVFVFR